MLKLHCGYRRWLQAKAAEAPQNHSANFIVAGQWRKHKSQRNLSNGNSELFTIYELRINFPTHSKNNRRHEQILRRVNEDATRRNAANCEFVRVNRQRRYHSYAQLIHATGLHNVPIGNAISPKLRRIHLLANRICLCYFRLRLKCS
jgi:hypothetical protein